MSMNDRRFNILLKGFNVVDHDGAFLNYALHDFVS